MQPPFPSLTAEWHNEPYATISPTQPHLSLADKTIMVTGGGRGIGNRIAHALASAGASIIGITGRTESSLADVQKSITSQYPNTKVLTFAADVLDEAAMSLAFASLKRASPSQRGVDMLVHNAGYFADLVPIGAAAADTAEYWKSFEINVRGSYITTRAFLSTLRPKADDHEPVLIAMSTAGICFFPPPPGFSSYGTSMVAKARFFESVAFENPDVRVHNVHPGAIATEMGQKATDAGLVLPQDDSECFLLKRAVGWDADNVIVELPAHFIVWLASKEGEFLRSKMVWASWDVEQLKAKKEKIAADPAFLNMGMNGWPYVA